MRTEDKTEKKLSFSNYLFIMCDPIIEEDNNLQTERFSKVTVKEYLEKREKFTKYPLRHYSQLETDFDEKQIKKILSKINIPVNGTKVTVFGGYTGEFSKCLRNLGMKVIFTDPIKEWVIDAKEADFEAYQYSAEEIPKNILARTDLFATFECYLPFMNSSSGIYTTLRFLTRKHGILFAASKKTHTEIIKEEGKLARMKSSFLPFKKCYAIERLEKGKGELKFYHFYSANDNQDIKIDYKIIKSLYDIFPSGTSIKLSNISSLVKSVGIPRDEVVQSLKRILKLYQINLNPTVRYNLPNEFCKFFSKTFYIDL